MGIFNYEEFDYDTVVKTNKGRHEKFKKYKDVYVNKENKKTYIEVFYNCFGKIKEIFSYIKLNSFFSFEFKILSILFLSLKDKIELIIL